MRIKSTRPAAAASALGILVALALLLPACTSRSRAGSVQPAAAEGKRILIVNGDDAGISADFTDATLRAWDSGALDSLSVVSCGNDADRAMAILKARPEIPVGLHFTLVGDWKPLSAGASLRGPDGNMWTTTAQAAERVRPEEAAAEFDAQLGKLQAAGIDVQCADSHVSGYFTSQAIFAAVLSRARSRGIPLVAEYYPGMPADWRPLMTVVGYGGIYQLPGGVEENPANRAAAYWKTFASYGPGVHYCFSHQGLGFPDPAPSGDRLIRVDDSLFWTDPATRGRIASMGIERSSTAALKAAFLAAPKGDHGR